jgi:hypothetical protein
MNNFPEVFIISADTVFDHAKGNRQTDSSLQMIRRKNKNTNY